MESSPLVQIRGRDVLVSSDEAALDAARVALRDDWFVRLPAFLDPPTLARVQRELDAGTLVEKEHPGVGVDACFESDVTYGRLEFQLNDRRLLAAVARIVGVARLGCFEGRIYRMLPEAGHHDDYHDDAFRDRVLGLSVNLSREHYEGGTLEIRKQGQPLVVPAPNTTPGDAVLFPIVLGMEHRVTRIEGATPKTALAGWFRTTPEFDALLRKRLHINDESQPPG